MIRQLLTSLRARAPAFERRLAEIERQERFNEWRRQDGPMQRALSVLIVSFDYDELAAVNALRAVLTAMRDPSDAMVKESFPFTGWAGDAQLQEAGVDAWQAMVDAALVELPS